MPELPQKDYFKLNEVCQVTDTQPYVLRFWESEFPQLNPERTAGGQPLYRRADVEIVQRIKELLYDEDFTLESAREQLTEEQASGKRPTTARKMNDEDLTEPAQTRAVAEAPAIVPPAPRTNGTGESSAEMISRRRYEDAVDEIDHLRMALKDTEKKLRRAESDLEGAAAESERERGRADRALAHLENLRRLLSDPAE